MNTAKLNQLVDAVLTHWQAERSSPAWTETEWAYDRLLDLCLEGPFEDLWAVILSLYTRPMSDESFAVLAAGPMEDLLKFAGPSFIDRIEALAATDDRFNQLLGGVWRSSIDPEVWARIERMRRSTW